MASCPACGADITHTRTREGERIPLEKWEDTTGPRRYRIVDFGPPMICEPIAEASLFAGYPDHRVDCPKQGNGVA